VENLDLGHGQNGEGPDPKAAPRKGWPGSFAIRSTRLPTPCGGQLVEPLRERRSMGRAGGVTPEGTPDCKEPGEVSREALATRGASGPLGA
jgi:hypothetical protein